MSEDNQRLGVDNYCFACGTDNPIGLKLDFHKTGDEYVAEFVPLREHQGYPGVTHGGIVATLLDEAIARFAWAEGGNTVTAEMNVRYRRPVPTGAKLRIVGRIDEPNARVVHGSGEILDAEGRVLADATAKLVRVRRPGEDGRKVDG